MVFQTINKKLLELGPSLGFLYKKNRVYLGFFWFFLCTEEVLLVYGNKYIHNLVYIPVVF